MAKQQTDHFLAVLRGAQHGEHRARASFFHLDRRGEHVARTGAQQLFTRKGDPFGGHVVEVGFELDDLVVIRAALRRAEHRAHTVGRFAELFGANPVADPGNRHLRLRAERLCKMPQQRRAGRGAKLGFDAAAVGRHVL